MHLLNWPSFILHLNGTLKGILNIEKNTQFGPESDPTPDEDE